MCISCFTSAQDAGDDPTNAFASFGDCEGNIWVEATEANGVVLGDVQATSPGMVGNCCLIVQPQLWYRISASTVDAPTGRYLIGTDADLKFYYKIVRDGYGVAYPYIYFRQDITDNNIFSHPDLGATNVVYWSRDPTTGIVGETFISDGEWHLFDPNISNFDWKGETADLAINHLSYSYTDTSEFWIDEIYLSDPTPPVSKGLAWTLY